MDADWLIDLILSDAREHGSSSFEARGYREEPILRPASQLRPALPQMIREMRTVAKQSDPFRSDAGSVFLEQAKLMAQYEDTFEYTGSFQHYFPTYQAMNDDQLRGYFTFRTRVRAGEYPNAPASFVYVLVYELLHLIGVPDAQAGYAMLQTLQSEYGARDYNLHRCLKDWMWDFVIYYQLDPALLRETEHGRLLFAAETLRAYAEASDDALFAALAAASSYDVRRSRFFKNNEAVFRAVLCAAYRAYAAYYDAHRTRTLFESYFGRVYFERCRLFAGAVFRDAQRYEDASYTVNSLCEYRCVHRNWSRTGILTPPAKPKALGKFVKTVDALLRDAFHDPHPIKANLETAYVRALIEKTIAAVLETRKKEAALRRRQEVRIDFSKLAGIRAAAEVTRDRLLTEEDLAEEEAAWPRPPQPSVVDAAAAEAALPLTAVQCEFLRALLIGGDWRAAAKTAGQMPSILGDAVNEALFDLFADTVLEFDGDTPRLVEDYVEDLRGYLL